MLAVALGRPLGIEDADCDVEMPLPVEDIHLREYFNSGAAYMNSPQPTDDDKMPTTLMTGFNYLTKLYRIAGRILRTVYAVDAVEVCKEVRRIPYNHQPGWHLIRLLH